MTVAIPSILSPQAGVELDTSCATVLLKSALYLSDNSYAIGGKPKP